MQPSSLSHASISLQHDVLKHTSHSSFGSASQLSDSLPPVPAVPAVPALPEAPALPESPAVPAPPAVELDPDFPASPELPALPLLATITQPPLEAAAAARRPHTNKALLLI